MTDSGTRDQILLTAGEIFADAGFERATVRRISDQAGVNVAAINYHFGDKETLYSEAVRYAYSTRSTEVPMPEWSSESSPEARLRGFVTTLLTRMLGTDGIPWQSRLMMREVLQPTKACEPMVREHFRPQVDMLKQIVDELILVEAAEHRRMQIVFSVLGQCLFYRVSGPVVALMLEPDELREHYEHEQLSEHIADFTLAAISALNQSGGQLSPDPLGKLGGVVQ